MGITLPLEKMTTEDKLKIYLWRFFRKGGLSMAQPTTVETIAKKYSMSTDEFISLGSKLALKEKKKNFQIEKIEILARYSAETVNELQQKIKEGTVPEHPAWEDLIEIQNIEAEIKEIESDIKTL